MKLKTTTIEGKTYAEVDGDKPVYETDDGKRIAFDASGTVATISRLNGEAKGHREAKEAAEAKLKLFDGIEDGDSARKALETVRNLKEGDLVTAGKVEEIKAAAKRAAEEQVAAANKANADELSKLKTEYDSLSQMFQTEKIAAAFSGSKYVSDKLTPAGADLIRAINAGSIKVEEGRIVGYNAKGEKIYSRARPGDVADIDEIIETYVDSYPHKDHILKGVGASGGGSQPGNGSRSDPKTISRAEFDKLAATDQMSKMRDGYSVSE